MGGYLALSPNLSLNYLKVNESFDLFNYEMKDSLSKFCIDSHQMECVQNPRENGMFKEGLDNLFPVGILSKEDFKFERHPLYPS